MKRKILFFLPLLILVYNSLSAQDFTLKYADAMKDYESGDYLRAYKLFREITSASRPDDQIVSSSSYFAAMSLLSAGEKQGAASEFEYFIHSYKMSGQREDALFKLGLIYYDLGQHENCRITLNQFLDEFPASEYSGSAFFLIGEAYTAEGRGEDAEKFFINAIEKRRNNKFIHFSIYSLANLYEQRGDYVSAVKYYDRLLAYYRTSETAPYAQARIGLCYFRLKEYDNAILELSDPLITKLPDDIAAESRYILALSYYRAGEFGNAEKVYKELLVKPIPVAKKRDVQYGLAWVNFQQKKYEEAYSLFNLLAGTGTDTLAIKSLFWSGESKRYLGYTAEAQSIYEKFLQKYPEHPLSDEVKLHLGIVHFDKNETVQSEQFLISLDTGDQPTKSRALIVLGEIRLRNGEYEGARGFFSEALLLKSISPAMKNRAMLGTGISDFFLGENDMAIGILLRLVNESPQFESDKTNFYLAEAYAAKKEFGKALNYYNKIISSDELLNQQLVYGKAYAYFNIKDYLNAVYHFNEFLTRYKEDTKEIDARLRLADSYYGSKNYPGAWKNYEIVLNSKSSVPNRPYVHYQFAQALFRAGNADRAAEEFGRIQLNYPRSEYVDESQYLIGWIKFQQGDFDNAVWNYRLLFEKYPNSALLPVALYSIGDSYFNKAQYDSAVFYYNRLIESYSNTAYILDAVNGIQYSYVVQNRSDDAVKFLDNFLQKNPSSPYADQIYYKKCEVIYSTGNYSAAKENFIKFLSFYPNSRYVPDACYWLGRSFSMLEENNEALDYLNKVINSYPETEIWIASVIEAGRIYSATGDFDSALRIYNSALLTIKDREKAAEIYFIKANTELEKGEIQQAYESFSYIIQYHDGTIFSAKAKLEIGIIEIARGGFDNADILLKELAERRTDDIGAKAQYYYGLSLFEQNRLQDAISAFVRVRTVFSVYDEWLTRSTLKLGECYERLNDREKAKEMYRAVITKHRSDAYGKEAQEKLRKLK